MTKLVKLISYKTTPADQTLEPGTLARLENEGGPVATAADSSARPPAEECFAQDLKSIEELPAKTKELLLLKDQAEKTTGGESVALDLKIRSRSAS